MKLQCQSAAVPDAVIDGSTLALPAALITAASSLDSVGCFVLLQPPVWSASDSKTLLGKHTHTGFIEVAVRAMLCVPSILYGYILYMYECMMYSTYICSASCTKKCSKFEEDQRESILLVAHLLAQQRWRDNFRRLTVPPILSGTVAAQLSDHTGSDASEVQDSLPGVCAAAVNGDLDSVEAPEMMKVATINMTNHETPVPKRNLDGILQVSSDACNDPKFAHMRFIECGKEQQ